MKIGMNLLLWTTHVTEEHYPELEKIKSTGFDGVEIPIFGGDDAHYQKLRKKLDELQLKTSTVAVATPEASAISPDPAIRKAASERLKTIVRQSAILGADILCGPFHQALGVFSGTGPTEEEFKRAADVHREAANEAQRQGVCLAIEFLNRFECYFLTPPQPPLLTSVALLIPTSRPCSIPSTQTSKKKIYRRRLAKTRRR